MPRNAEVIRQWAILREIERTRGGVTIDDLATQSGVTTRTIRRDLQALEEAGFPLYDDRSHDDGRARWTLNGQAFRGLVAGLTLSELCALYFSRTVLEALSGSSFHDDVEHAFDKLTAQLPTHMRQFLDRLPSILATKRGPVAAQRSEQPQIATRLLDGILHQRQATVVYHSHSSDRTKTYLVHPYRLALAQGGLYVLAYVPEYQEIRTFAVDRVQTVTLLEERFTQEQELPDAAFPHSLGVHSGPPERVELEFQPSAAGYVSTHEWHESQQIEATSSGSAHMTLDVCIDRALFSWILSFGPSVRVIAPPALAKDIAAQLQRAGEQYKTAR